jgi:hypothetical protein
VSAIDTRHASHASKCLGGVGARSVHLHLHRFRSAQPRGQVVWRVDRHDLALVDDDDSLAGLTDFRKDVRAQDDRVIAGEASDELARLSMILLGSRPAVGSSSTGRQVVRISACASPTRWRYPFDSLPQ